MNYIDVYYPSDDGLQLYARDYPGPLKESPAVLCLPGLTRNSKDFSELAEKLSAHYRVICPDQRGRGRSQRDGDAARYLPMRYVQDMVTLLDTLEVKTVSVIGTSLGGMMGMVLLATQAARIDALVVNDMGPAIDPAGVARIISYVGKTAPAENWEEATDQTAHTNGVAFPDFTQSNWAAMARKLYVQQGRRPVLDYDPAISQGMSSGTATPDLWPLFDMMPPRPLLVIRGEITDILSLETLAEMQRRRPTAQTVSVPRVGHAPMLDEPAAEQAILSFLADVYRGA
jgi:pimeloyl-ACP methyl ester carboxylesterase